MRLLVCLLLIITFLSCSDDKNIPDVSDIKVPLTTLRFEKDFFALDSNKVTPGLDKLVEKYPNFGSIFLVKVLGVDTRWSTDTIKNYINGFKAYNRTVYDTAQYYYNDFTKYENQIKKGLQFVKYYYPTYPLPTKIITFIGPADGVGDFIGTDFLSVGLHAHLGSGFELYNTEMVQQTYPAYITANFTADFITINCLKNVVSDMYPDNNEDKRLLIQMIEKGKKLYLLSKFLPTQPEHQLIGYTAEQLKDCYSHEKVIWDMFVQNNFLQIADNNLIKNYVTDGPKTQELGEKAPGNIGSFAGWQIVKKYASKYPNVQVDSLMHTDDELIYQQAKYKP